MENNNRFVIYPHDGECELTPSDKLIYLAIRRYMDKDTMEAFPSYTTLTKDIGAAAKTLKKAIVNLQRAGYISTRKDGRKVIYKFNNKRKFEPFSYDFLDNKDLTFTEKSYIVASQQYMFKDNEEGKINIKNKELSVLINMPESTISKCNYSLQEKGYLTGASDITKRFQLRELDQLFIWKFKDHEEKIQRNTNDIDLLKKQVAQLVEENKLLKHRLKIRSFVL